MDLNTATQGAINATKAIFDSAAPTTTEAIRSVTSNVSSAVMSVGQNTVGVLEGIAKFTVNLFFPGTVA